MSEMEIQRENRILHYTVGLKEKEIQTLSRNNNELQAEKATLESYIHRFQTSWSEMMSNLSSCIDACSSGKTSEPKIYQELLPSENSIEEIRSFTEKIVKQLLRLIEKQSAADITGQNRELKDSYIKAAAQINKHQHELNQTSKRLLAKEQELEAFKSNLEQLNQDLMASQQKVAELSVNCECPCTCGARSSYTPSDDQLNNEQYKLLFQQESQMRIQLQLELELSEERFIQSRVFKKIIRDGRSMKNHIQQLSNRIEELQKTSSAKQSPQSTDKALQSEIQKTNFLRGELEEFRSKYYALETKKHKFTEELSTFKSQEPSHKTSFKDPRIDQLEYENASLKTQVHYLKQNQADLTAKNPPVEIEETRFELPPEPEDDLSEDRLSQYRRYVHDLKAILKERERNIRKLENYKREMKEKISIEKRAKGFMNEEQKLLNKSYDESIKKNQQMFLKIHELEERISQAVKEKIESEKIKELYHRESLALDNKLTAKEELLKSIEELNQQLVEEKGNDEDRIVTLENSLKSLEDELRKVISANNAQIKHQEEYSSAKKDLREKIRTAETFCLKQCTAAAQFKFLHEQATHKIKALERECAQKREKPETELSKYRNLMTCKVCQIRFKDTVLVKCLHSFCRHCIDSLVCNRYRKCPSCLVSFNLDDIKEFNWD